MITVLTTVFKTRNMQKISTESRPSYGFLKPNKRHGQKSAK